MKRRKNKEQSTIKKRKVKRTIEQKSNEYNT